MNILTSDFETTRFPEGNPFSKHLKAVCLGWKEGNEPSDTAFSLYGPFPSFDKDFLSYYDLCIFFNAKFDLHWYRRLGFEMPKNVWCCQLAEYILSRQTWVYPSLDETAEKYGLGKKLDVIKLEYWDKGIDTDAIPQPILSEYCRQDVDLTYAIYLRQQAAFIQNPGLYRLFKLACQDLLVLQEMEWNGLLYNEELCNTRLEECKQRSDKLVELLNAVYPHLAINFNSGDQLSSFLYGGTIIEETKQQIGFFKTGERKGQPKYQNIEIVHTLPRLVEPLPKTEMAKEGKYSTAEGTLKKLKGKFAKKFVPILLELAKLDKLMGTYYEGIPKLNKEMNWEPSMLHGQFNQVVAATGRLSSTKPNLQNFAGDINDIFVSRYNE